jgi:hypothetical protein
VLAGLATLLLAGLVTLALRILLLLAGFLAAALLLTGVLALLTGILVLLVRHIGKLPCRTSEAKTTAGRDFGCSAEPGSSRLSEPDHDVHNEISSVQAFMPRRWPVAAASSLLLQNQENAQGLPGPENSSKSSL